MARLRNRIVKAEFWTDGELLRWPRDKRTTYKGLWALAEDSGCLEDDPFTWKLMLWPSPVDADITVGQLETWRDELIAAGKMIPYEAEGKTYLYLTKFHQHEHPRNPQRPDLPLPAWIVWEANESDLRKGQYREATVVVQALNNEPTSVPVPSCPAPSRSYKPLSDETPDPPVPRPSKAVLVRARFEHWRATFPEETQRLSLTKDRARAISARLSEGIAPETIDEAVANARGDPWWNGAQDGEWKADIKTICGKGSTVENLAARSRHSASGLERLRAQYGGEP